MVERVSHAGFWLAFSNQAGGFGDDFQARENPPRSDGERDSLGRNIDGKSVAAVLAKDAGVRREIEARWIYLQTAYREPKEAEKRLNTLMARDGATSTARRLAAEPGYISELRGREGLLAGAQVRAERQAAIRAAAAIGPNVTRFADVESQAAQAYRDSVAAQLKSDQTAIPKLSERPVGGLGRVAAARTDEARMRFTRCWRPRLASSAS